jgi:hypothetical protein
MIFVHLLPRKPNLERKKKFIQTNSFRIFTCPNPVLLVPGFGQVGYREDWYVYKKRRHGTIINATTINQNPDNNKKDLLDNYNLR